MLNSRLSAILRLSPRLALTLTAVLGLSACGDKVTYIECPIGTLPQGSECIPIEPDTQSEDTQAPQPDTTPSPDTTPLDDTQQAPDTNLSDTEDVATDTDVAETIQRRDHGSPCSNGSAECVGSFCLGWPNGYCTQTDCTTDSCGESSICAPLQGNQLCLKRCTNGECERADQRCKTLAVDGGYAQVCIGVEPPLTTTGGACSDLTDCEGSDTCLSSFPGGYCATIGCPDQPCPTGASCVRVDGQATCLQRCQTDAQCNSTPGAERKCGAIRAIGGGVTDVCISGAATQPLGSRCNSDFECSSGSCQILGEGRCSQTRSACNTSADCNGAEYCDTTPGNRLGVCSQPCGTGRTCPGAAHCVSEGSNPRDAWCRPACTPNGNECNGDLGMVCAYGLPFADSGQGAYACTMPTRPGTLTRCNGLAECGGQACITAGAGATLTGHCSATCGDDGYCAFGGVCLYEDSDQCRRLCRQNSECPAGFSCGRPQGASRDMCVPN